MVVHLTPKGLASFPYVLHPTFFAARLYFTDVTKYCFPVVLLQELPPSTMCLHVLHLLFPH